jgi:DNA polymerase
MENSKKEKYSELVEKRKQCKLCKDLTNPSKYGSLDSNQIGPWSRWQGNLDAKLMVIGQDWGTVGYFKKWGGLDQPHGNPTNDNLIELLLSIGISIENPGIDQRGGVFFTNAVLCLKEGNLQSPIKPEWVQNCGEKFLKPLIELIYPKIVVALGEKAFKAVVKAYNLQIKWSKYKELVEANSIFLQEGVSLFPVFHCGARIINTHRNKETQVKDWKRIGLGLAN